jgi:hypothetical protein
LLSFWEFRGRTYCGIHYEEHMERESDVEKYLFEQHEDPNNLINCSKCGKLLPRPDVFHWCINSFTEIKK